MFRVLAALLFSTFTFVSAHADPWYLSPIEPDNLGIAVAELPLNISTADFVSADGSAMSAALALLPEDEALLMSVASIADYENITTGSIELRSAPAFTAASMFILTEPWAVSRADYEAQLTP